MSRLWNRCRSLALDVYLWAQRRSWPVPAVVRSVGRDALGKIIGQTIPDRTDEWLNPLIPGAREEDSVGPSSNDSSNRAAEVPPPAPVCSTSTSPRSAAHPLLRCVVATPFLDVGGLDRVAALLARRLPAHGIDTTVVHAAITDPRFRGTGDALRLDGVGVVNLSPRNSQRWLKKHRPDVISAHGVPDWLVAEAAEASIPIIETLHGAHSFFDPETWPRERVRSEQITGFVAVSELVRRQYLRANPGYPPDRVITIPNGVDDQHIGLMDRTRARGWLGLRNEFLFVSLARCALQKNTFGLVTAFSDVAGAYPGAHLLVAGRIDDPAYFEQLRRLRDGLPCAGQIHLRGHCPDASSVLGAADAFVLDSFFEGWSLASMEALFAGLPVVMSEVGGAHEQVGENGRRGFVVGNPLGDPEAMDWHRMSRARFSPQVNQAALVEAMSVIVADSDRWQEKRGELQEESVRRFSAELCLQRHAEILTRAAAGKPLQS